MIDRLLTNIPRSPGIYKFLNKKGEIIYVGKSLQLYNRVHSYFQSQTKLNFAKQKMVKQITNIETIITNNERESLILETTLIKKHQPKYNVLMKDGKNHVYIHITNELIPRIIKTRKRKNSGKYFGPYTNTSYVRNILKLLKKLFGYRSCNITFTQKNNGISMGGIGNTKIPCMDYYIKRCAGPCLLEKNAINEYQKSIQQIEDFMKGNFSHILKDLGGKMQKHAKKLEFEKAKEVKDIIESIQSLKVGQIVQEGIKGDYDIIQVIDKFENMYVGIIEIRDGKMTGYYNYDINNQLQENQNTILKGVIEKRFIENEKKKVRFIIALTPALSHGEREIIDGIDIEVPKQGRKKELLDLCYRNIYEYACKRHLDTLSVKGFSKKDMQNILSILGYKTINKDILFECNDISHIAGSHTVASRSIIENGRPNSNKYRKFHIKSLETGKIDDFQSLREVMERRIKEIQKTGYIPDLIIIDGGKGQLSSVMSIINKSSNPQELSPKEKESNQWDNLKNQIQVVSIAKREEELFLPNASEPILLKKDSKELKLIQKIRDEAHRFAITFNRDQRIKAMKKNILESIPGIGAKTRKKILTHFGNVENLKEVAREDLENLLNKNIIEQLDIHGII